MTEKDIVAVATLLTSNDIHQTAIADLLLAKGIITEEEFQARIDVRMKEDFKRAVEVYQKIIREITRRPRAESGDKKC